MSQTIHRRALLGSISICGAGLERSMSPSLNFDGTGGCEEGKTGGRDNC